MFKRLAIVVLSIVALSLTGAVLLRSKVAKAQGYPLPVFKLPYYANTGPFWSGGPHQWGVPYTSVYDWLYTGSGLDFADAGLSFPVANMADGTVIFVGYVDDPVNGHPDGLGLQVAVKHSVGGSVVIYGHLASVDSLVQAGRPISVGNRIGMSGMTGNANGQIHVHLELRDGADSCCSLEHLGGNPVHWHGTELNGYRIYDYRPNELGVASDCPSDHGVVKQCSYNYDGVAVKVSNIPSDLGPFERGNFSYVDYLGTGNSPLRTGVWTFLPLSFPCDGISNCENNSLTPDVQFAGHGQLGGGGILWSDLQPPITTSTPVPVSSLTPTNTLVPTNTPPPTCGTSIVSFYTAADFFCDPSHGYTQYGWSNPTNGWVNMPDYMDNQASSLAVTQRGWSIWVAEDPNGSGGRKCLAGYYNLSSVSYDNGHSANDSVSSVWVFNDETCGGQIPPNTPTNLRLVGVTQTSAYVMWDDNSTNESGFKVYIWTPPTWTLVGSTAPNVNYFTAINRPCGHGDTYQVSSYNSYGESGRSNALGAITDPCSATPVPTLTGEIQVFLDVNPLTVAPGGSVTVQWVTNQSSGNDWISMHPVTDTDGSKYITWQPANGISGSLNFTAPMDVGSYNFRYYRNGVSWNISDAFQVVAAVPSSTPLARPTSIPGIRATPRMVPTYPYKLATAPSGRMTPTPMATSLRPVRPTLVPGTPRPTSTFVPLPTTTH